MIKMIFTIHWLVTGNRKNDVEAPTLMLKNYIIPLIQGSS